MDYGSWETLTPGGSGDASPGAPLKIRSRAKLSGSARGGNKAEVGASIGPPSHGKKGFGGHARDRPETIRALYEEAVSRGSNLLLRPRTLAAFRDGEPLRRRLGVGRGGNPGGNPPSPMPSTWGWSAAHHSLLITRSCGRAAGCGRFWQNPPSGRSNHDSRQQFRRTRGRATRAAAKGRERNATIATAFATLVVSVTLRSDRWRCDGPAGQNQPHEVIRFEATRIRPAAEG